MPLHDSVPGYGSHGGSLFHKRIKFDQDFHNPSQALLKNKNVSYPRLTAKKTEPLWLPYLVTVKSEPLYLKANFLKVISRFP